MLKSLLLGVSIVALAGIATASAQQPPAGIKRTPLQKIEFPDGYHTVTGIAEIEPGGAAGRHTHPGLPASGESFLPPPRRCPERWSGGSIDLKTPSLLPRRCPPDCSCSVVTPAHRLLRGRSYGTVAAVCRDF